jgi:hypothetical protein
MKNRLIILVTLMLLASAIKVDADSYLSDKTALSMHLQNQVPDPGIPGDIVELRLALQNIGGAPTKNLIVELLPAYPFELVAGEPSAQAVGIIGGETYGDDVKIIKFRLRIDKDAQKGSHMLDVRYHDEGGTAYTMIAVPVEIANREIAEIIHINRTVLVPGAQDVLKFTINNVGKAPINDLTFSWESQNNVVLPVGSSNAKYVGHIPVGGKAEVEYKVIADTSTSPGLYQLNLMLASREANISTKAGIYIGGDTDFDLSLSESSGTSYSFSIANIGSNPAYSVVIRVPKQPGWRASIPDSSILGNLDTGDYTVATFTLERLGTSSEGVSLEIDFTNTMGKRKVVQKSILLNAQPVNRTAARADMTEMMSRGNFRAQTQPRTSYIWYIVGVAFALLAIVGFLHYRKRKLMDPSFRLFRK